MVMGEVGYFWRRYFWRRRYFWWKIGEENGRMEKFGEFGGKKRKEGKRKKERKMKKGSYFIGRKSENN